MKRAAPVLFITLLAACREPSAAPPGPSEPTESSASLGGAPPDPSASDERSARDVTEAALEDMAAFPPIHGVVRYEGPEADLLYEIWVRDPAIRVELTLGGESIAWITDGERSNMEEPHCCAGVLFLVDPRQDFLYSCSGPVVLGSKPILGRSTTGLGCTGGSPAEYWFDDETGLILQGIDAEGVPWTFTQLEFDPAFPPDAFDVESA